MEFQAAYDVLWFIDLYLQPTDSVLHYSVTGDALALQYFQVDTTSGNISVLVSLLNDPALNHNYQVGKLKGKLSINLF